MILNKLFKAKWQHKDANVRIEAIKNFELNETANVEILNRLVNDDISELVRRAALLKLNQYSVFLHASIDNSLPAIRQFSLERVQQQILNNQNVSAEQKHAYLNRCEKIAFLEQWLLIEHDHSLLKGLLAKVNKPNLLGQFMIKSDNIDLQTEILARIDDLHLLEKLSKKAVDSEFKTMLIGKISNLRELAEKPGKLRKQIQLLLSKLLALKDLQDYALMLQRQESLQHEWLQVEQELDCLATDEQTIFVDKYNDISQSLKKHFAAREEAYRHQQFIAEQDAKKLAQSTEFANVIQTISQQISDAVFENIELDQPQVSQQLEALIVAGQDSLLTKTEQQALLEKIEQLQNKLNQLPQVAECVSSATGLISKLSTLSLPTTIEELNQRKPIFDDWQKQWQKINALANDILPHSIIAARDQLQFTWLAALKPLIKEQHHAADHVRKKISELKRLVANGKYKSAFGLHKKLTFLINDLSAEQQLKIAHDFESISKRIDELHELESFVVTPRKQELLEKIRALITSPLDNPQAQAEQVKSFRKHWNSLGHADESLDKELNDAFNQACEEAFAPCRAFYAEQGEIRANHLQVKQEILSKLAVLLEDSQHEEVNWRQIDNRLHKIQSSWRDAGDVDRSEYQKIQPVFRKLVDPIKTGIHKFQKQNADAKQNLVALAKLQLDNEDVFAAINELKTLQNKWRDIGFAGPNKENSLWQTFRKVNDQIFAKRNDIQEQQQADISAQVTEFNQQLNLLNEQLTNAATEQELRQLMTAFESFIDAVKALKPMNKDLVNKASNSVKQLRLQLQQAEDNKKQQVFEDLFALLSSSATTSVAQLQGSEQYQRLSNVWQKSITQAISSESNSELRAQVTLELEIIANVDSPKELANERMQVQVNLLSSKMMQGDDIDLTSKLKQWLGCGVLQESESQLLERIKAIFVS
ncbi:DUF349 domain-containing protein [Thalassotalea sp. ND16A]|uniref:DUF349 domain-containing protein n=1 Tax=Thalassotalea sp. ND16A TaxID=1535422 RepID=UPI00051A5629|nr:DUF349 domain-containing protein [Thalassotalea sp. ND16A]KGJ98354.1 hypothetical protein ND16A_0663 [Thalassotalea sp. ND16A]